MAKKTEPKHKYDKRVESHIASIVVDSEYRTSHSNRDDSNADFEAFVALFDSERTERDYDWMSNISLPEFTAHMLTQSSIDVAQYFQSRDFVEAYLEDESEESYANAQAAKECINRTLNQKHLHHYQKYVRAKLINHLQGNVYVECWWEKKSTRGIIGRETRVEQLDVDEYGNPLVDLDIQVPAMRQFEVDIEGEIPVIDRFNYDVHDPRNVFTDNRYVYSLQDKHYVIFRSEKTIDDLKHEKERNGYFNLEVIEAMNVSGETETRRDTNKDDEIIAARTPSKAFDILKRYGKFWCKVIKRDESGEPMEVKPGIDINGDPFDDAELLETIITYALVDSGKVLIGFHLTPYLDGKGNPYRPITRGLCYIHPTLDEGAGDGKYSRELQVAINDTLNISNDRVQLATIPTFKTKKYATDDNDSLYMEPGHNIRLEDVNDMQELQISDNIQGAMNQIAMLTNSMDKVTSIFPTTMGGQGAASATATAIAGAETRTDMRTNYKSVTFENTALTELYWMILQMTSAFAHPDTGMRLMGEKVYDFDPTKDYYYKPVSASIETEQSKNMKIQRYMQILQTVSGIGHPDTVNMVNELMTRIYSLMGDEYVNFSQSLLNPEQPIMQGAGSPEEMEMAGGGASNQYGIEQSMPEQGARGATFGL